MAIPGNIRDRDHRSFVESPSRGDGQTAREVYVGNNSGQPIPVVDVGIAGQMVNAYNEILSLAGSATSDIVLYTVPVDKKLYLRRVTFSGENKAVYTIDLNGSIQAKKRTWYTHYNDDIIFEDIELLAGDVVKLTVTNETNSVADFNGNLQGVLTDA